jgi:tRNA(Ile)-lysidine synthase
VGLREHTTLPLLRRDFPEIAKVLRAWRRLTSPARARRAGPGKPVLIAVSGGADSSALAIALANSGTPMVMAHVVHDLRPIEQAHADRDAAHALARALDVPFVEASVRVREGKHNLESRARQLRYAALVELAREHNLAFIATAHHGDDQLESILMALIRGSGPRGLSGIAPRKRLAPGVTLIRPMLELTHQQAIAICRVAGWPWREDETNSDTSRTRSALRHEVIPRLLAIAPHARERAAQSAAHQRALAKLIDSLASPHAGTHWTRAQLRALAPVVLAQVLRDSYVRLRSGRGADQLRARTLDAAVRIIRSSDTEPRELQWSRARVEITARSVTMRPA